MIFAEEYRIAIEALLMAVVAYVFLFISYVTVISQIIQAAEKIVNIYDLTGASQINIRLKIYKLSLWVATIAQALIFFVADYFYSINTFCILFAVLIPLIFRKYNFYINNVWKSVIKFNLRQYYWEMEALLRGFYYCLLIMLILSLFVIYVSKLIFFPKVWLYIISIIIFIILPRLFLLSGNIKGRIVNVFSPGHWVF